MFEISNIIAEEVFFLIASELMLKKQLQKFAS